MTKGMCFFLGALLIAGPGLITLAQVSISPPTANSTTTPATTETSTPSASTNAGRPANLPSAQSVLEGLLNEKPAATAPAHVDPAMTNPALVPTLKAAAPTAPTAVRIREGQFIWNRTGHLVKDDKTGTFFFSFEADGKNMADPPMALIPSHLLNTMEDASDKGALPVTFKISGEVTEYRGKNFLYVRYMQAVRDMNQGIGK